ncbi:MAG: VTT domain-containing protein [Dehalococcoidales bacterium]
MPMYNIDIMPEKTPEEKTVYEVNKPIKEVVASKKSPKWVYALGIFGVVITILMAVAIIIYKDEVRDLQNYGYFGAFFISLLGGATVIVPVPMLAIVFALGGVMPYPWLVAIFAALGEVVGAMTIYATGRGAGHAISQSKHTRVQKYYDKLLNLIRKRGTITLLIVTSIVNPFFYPAAFAAGALKFGLKKYIPIILVGKLIKSFTVVYAGYFGLKGIFHAIGIEI